MINWMMAVEGFEDYDLSSLRNFQYGGGPMRSVVEAALEAFPCTMIQGYGQTEGMTMTFLSQEDHQRAIAGDHLERLGSCGREGFVSEILVVDPDGNPVPRDGSAAGEIIVRSEANMLGYWRRPDLTEKTARDGWMWTGDIATRDAEGYVFIVDRAKDMIISGGEHLQHAGRSGHSPASGRSGIRGIRHPRRHLGRGRQGGGGIEARSNRDRGGDYCRGEQTSRLLSKTQISRFRGCTAQGTHGQDPETGSPRPVLAGWSPSGMSGLLSEDVLSHIGNQSEPRREIVTT